MALKLKRFQEAKWFDYPGAEGVRFLIRPLPLSEGLAIRSRIRERVPTEIDLQQGKNKGKITTLLEDIDTGKYTWEIFNFILQDVEGVDLEDVPGASLEEKKKAIFDDIKLREYISDQAEMVRLDGERKLDSEIKN